MTCVCVKTIAHGAFFHIRGCSASQSLTQTHTHTNTHTHT